MAKKHPPAELPPQWTALSTHTPRLGTVVDVISPAQRQELETWLVTTGYKLRHQSATVSVFERNHTISGAEAALVVLALILFLIPGLVLLAVLLARPSWLVSVRLEPRPPSPPPT